MPDLYISTVWSKLSLRGPCFLRVESPCPCQISVSVPCGLSISCLSGAPVSFISTFHLSWTEDNSLLPLQPLNANLFSKELINLLGGRRTQIVCDNPHSFRWKPVRGGENLPQLSVKAPSAQYSLWYTHVIYILKLKGISFIFNFLHLLFIFAGSRDAYATACLL